MKLNYIKSLCRLTTRVGGGDVNGKAVADADAKNDFFLRAPLFIIFIQPESLELFVEGAISIQRNNALNNEQGTGIS